MTNVTQRNKRGSKRIVSTLILLPLQVVALLLLTTMVGCASPEEKIAEYLQTGDALLSQGDLAKARVQYRSALQLDDQVASAWFGLAKIAEREQKWQQVLGFVTRCVELAPNHVEALTLRGEVLLLAGEYDQVLLITDTLAALEPESASVMALRAGALYRLDQTSEAIALAEQALKLDPSEQAATMMLAAAMMQSNKPQQALAYVEQGLSAGEPSIPLLLMQINALTAMSKLDEAEEVYLGLVTMYPNNKGLRLRLVDFYLQQFNTAAAEGAMRELVNQFPDDETALKQLLALLNQTGGADAAIAEIDARIEASPEKVWLQFSRIELLSAAGEEDKAEQALLLLAEQAPDLADRLEAQSQLARRLLLAGDEQAALALVNDILNQDPRFEAAVILKASLRLDRRQLTEAIAELRSVLQDNPSSAAALLLLARAYELEGTVDLADDTYSRAVQAQLDDPRYALEYAKFLRKADRAGRAITVLSTSREQSPRNTQLLAALADLYLQTGDWFQAEQLTQQLGQLDAAAPELADLRARVMASTTNREQGIDYLERAATSNSNNNAPLTRLIQAYMRAGESDKALSFLTSVLNDNPENTNARLLQAQVLRALGESDGTRNTFESILQRDTSVIPAYTGYARFLIDVGDTDAARALMERGVAANPDSFTLKAVLASVLEQIGEQTEAIPLYSQLLEQEPNADLIANNLANLLVDYSTQPDDLARAYEMSQRFRQSTVPEFQDTFGWVLYRMGRFDEALPFLRGAASGRPNNALIRYHYGRVLVTLKQYAKAEVEYAQALASADNDDLVEQISSAQAELQKTINQPSS